MEKLSVSRQLQLHGFNKKQIKRWNNVLHYRGIKFKDVDLVSYNVNLNTIRFFVFDYTEVLEFSYDF